MALTNFIFLFGILVLIFLFIKIRKAAKKEGATPLLKTKYKVFIFFIVAIIVAILYMSIQVVLSLQY